jgi:CheY-like chemotaxis protein
MVLAAMLEGTGYQLDTVADGAEAVEAVSRLRYGIVLMDVQMPTLDGVEATRLIRERYENCAALPIIALTANAMRGDRESYISAGMCDYLPKPLNKHDLLKRLWHWTQTTARHLSDKQTPDVETEGCR